ncbi:hypothetical protein [Klebsiella pasteurii]|uniref:hypothetical protein n=1 Tax=Klebsiella pasteurii TaxID=2587529 RepID=UPI001C7CECCC|nr:hypothetical protein [Klebsiella pasteurii]
MTKSTITRERLEKIKSWRETYGAGSNVMLPAEEAEDLARIALAAMESEPVAWTDEEELRDVNVAGIGYLFGIDREANKFADPRRQIMLYRHAQQPVVLDGLIAAVNRLLDSDGSRGCYSAIRCGNARFEVERLLAAAPQEVPDGK